MCWKLPRLHYFDWLWQIWGSAIFPILCVLEEPSTKRNFWGCCCTLCLPLDIRLHFQPPLSLLLSHFCFLMLTLTFTLLFEICWWKFREWCCTLSLPLDITGWSKATVTNKFSLANLKIPKNGLTQSFLESLYAAVLVFWCLSMVRWKKLCLLGF